MQTNYHISSLPRKIDLAQMARLLSYIENRRPNTLNDIAKCLGVSRVTANRLLLAARQYFGVDVYCHKDGYRIEDFGVFDPTRLAEAADAPKTRCDVFDTIRILRYLVENEEGVPLRDLAVLVKRTESGVWRTIDRLKAVNVRIESAEGRGRYRLCDSGIFDPRGTGVGGSGDWT